MIVLPYWVLFWVPAWVAMQSRRPAPIGEEAGAPRLTFGWLLAGMLLIVMVGWRYEVGGDWGNYLNMFESTRRLTLGESIAIGDPGYQLLVWISDRLDLGIVGVNALGALLFVSGLISFCRTMPRPWLALAVAVPYLVVVVGMGYTRQGIALGLAMLGMVSLRRGSAGRFVLWVLIATTFHRSAAVLLPVAALASSRNRLRTALLVAVTLAVGWGTGLGSVVDRYFGAYIDAEMQSQGAQVRLAMNAVPAALLLWRQRQFAFVPTEAGLWRWFAIFALALLVLLPVVPSSTALDRAGLYLLPLQLVVFAHLPNVLGARDGSTKSWELTVLAYYAVAHFTWLNFAAHRYFWVPYKSWLIEGL